MIADEIPIRGNFLTFHITEITSLSQNYEDRVLLIAVVGKFRDT